MRYIIVARVLKVERLDKIVNTHKVADEVVYEKQDLGWFVHFEGSWESICFGPERPQFDAGDMVKITFERTSNAQPSGPSE